MGSSLDIVGLKNRLPYVTITCRPRSTVYKASGAFLMTNNLFKRSKTSAKTKNSDECMSVMQITFFELIPQAETERQEWNGEGSITFR